MQSEDYQVANVCQDVRDPSPTASKLLPPLRQHGYRSCICGLVRAACVITHVYHLGNPRIQANDNISSALILKMLEWASMNFLSFGIDGGFFTLDPTMVILTGVPFDCKSCLMSCRNFAASGPASQQRLCQDPCSSLCHVHHLQDCRINLIQI